jgi:hypothetical protein
MLLGSNFFIGGDDDPATSLPPEAARRFYALDALDAANVATIQALSERAQDARERKSRATRRIRELTTTGPAAGLALSAADTSVVVAQRELDGAESALFRIAAQREELAPRNAVGNLLQSVKVWLRGQSGRAFVEAPREPAALLKGETTDLAVERLRRRLRELDADTRRTEAAPVPSARAKAAARAKIDELAERGTIDASNFVEHGLDPALRLPTTVVSIVVPGPQYPVPIPIETIDAAALFASIMRPQLIEAIERGIDEAADDDNALTDEARAAELAQIASDRLAIEYAEGDLLASAEGAGILPRRDMSPAAFLGVTAIDSADADEGDGLPPTSPGRGSFSPPRHQRTVAPSTRPKPTLTRDDTGTVLPPERGK